MPIDYEKDLDTLREKMERFCNNLQPCRRIATRYEKLSPTCLAFMHLAAVWILVK